MSIELRQVTKQFGDNAVVSNVTFNVKEGELMALLGPSGGGKTTVLRMTSRSGWWTPRSARNCANGSSPFTMT